MAFTSPIAGSDDDRISRPLAVNLRSFATGIFEETLRRLDIFAAVSKRVRCRDERIQIDDWSCNTDGIQKITVIAMGKAASPMCDALLAALEPFREARPVTAIVVGATKPGRPDPAIRFYPGSHPLPSEVSRAAASDILNTLLEADENTLVFFLISGGASAMVELPLDPDISIEETIDFYRQLVHSGLPINSINTLRKHFSQVKGGRLALAAGRASQCTLLLSDVPENLLHSVGSGPSLPDPSSIGDCRQILARHPAALMFSPHIQAFLLSSDLPETPKAVDPVFRNSSVFELLSSNDLCRVAKECAAAHSFHVEVDNNCDEWDYQRAAVYLVDRLQRLLQNHNRVCLLSAGELSVSLTANHGVGGRNQQFALYCARLLADRKMKATVMSAGSDGIDGNSPAAGALCDETTVMRASEAGIDVAAELKLFNSFSVFSALGDAVITGPTGNNIRDLRILLSERSD